MLAVPCLLLSCCAVVTTFIAVHMSTFLSANSLATTVPLDLFSMQNIWCALTLPSACRTSFVVQRLLACKDQKIESLSEQLAESQADNALLRKSSNAPVAEAGVLEE